jgi:hypothetical protein
MKPREPKFRQAERCVTCNRVKNQEGSNLIGSITGEQPLIIRYGNQNVETGGGGERAGYVTSHTS